MLSSPEKPPFTILTKPAALLPFVPVFVKDKLSPILYPVPALSITISVIWPGPISWTWNNAPTPPAVTLIVSSVEFSEPSFVIFLLPGIPVTLALIKKSSVSDVVPCTSSPTVNKPCIESSFKINWVTVSAPIWNWV